MNRQQEHSCIAYFKSNPVWNRVFRGFWEKYRSYGTFSGKVVLQKLTAEEVEGLEGFFAKVSMEKRVQRYRRSALRRH